MAVHGGFHQDPGSRDAADEDDASAWRTRLTPARRRPTPSRNVPERLWRDVIGEEIRRIRTARTERLADVARRAGISPQYLSEIERGAKDPSSESLAAVAGALGTTVEGLAQRAYRLAPVVPLHAAQDPSRRSTAPRDPVCLAA